jgi:N-carbamoyl-L-amino-acid hydrolase
MARIGATGDGGCRRLALSDEDRQGRDRLLGWMRKIGLEVRIDKIGNMIGIYPGHTDAAPVMLGSHIDTVASGGKYDGALGVLAALETAETLRDAGISPRRPLAIIAFTNEEGSRFQPDILGSCVWTGDTSLDDAYRIVDSEGKSIGDELRRIGYLGDVEPGFLQPHAYLELHIEQGPILDAEGGGIGAVTGVQALWWSEINIEGEANHAGTTPMHYRRSASVAACRLVMIARALTDEIDGLVANVGRMAFDPGNVNVVPRRATMTLDLRHPDDATLSGAERSLATSIGEIERQERVVVECKDLARFAAQPFDSRIIQCVEESAKALDLNVRRMVSGASHDAQIMATVTPTAMIFVPSVKGLSHNPQEFTRDEDVVAGANVLLTTAIRLAEEA